jgi:hypothetical protein
MMTFSSNAIAPDTVYMCTAVSEAEAIPALDPRALAVHVAAAPDQ